MTTAGVAAVPFLDMGAVNAPFAPELTRLFQGIVEHGRFVGGPHVERFEEEYAAYCGAAACVGVANGTDALELILRGLGIGPGDEVVVPANTFVATAEAVCAAGARPVFADVRPDTLLVDADRLQAALGPRTAAVIPVHLFGQMVELEPVMRLARRHGIAVVEDAAQAHGATFAGRRAGGVGHAAGFSFYPAKNLGALGDAGAVVTSDLDLAARVRRLADHGRAEGDRHRHDQRGRNSRLDGVQAAVLSVKLRSLDAANAQRRDAMAAYAAQLPAGCRPVDVHPQAASVHHLAVVQVDDRRRCVAELSAEGIGHGIHYPVPCHRQPAFAEFAREDLPHSERAAERVLSLPLWPGIGEDEVRRVCEVLERAVT